MIMWQLVMLWLIFLINFLGERSRQTNPGTNNVSISVSSPLCDACNLTLTCGATNLGFEPQFTWSGVNCLNGNNNKSCLLPAQASLMEQVAVCDVRNADTNASVGSASCKINMERFGWGEACSHENPMNECQDGLQCDILNKCKRGVGFTCDVNASKTNLQGWSPCFAGTQCIQNMCICNPLATVDHNGWCEPVDGRVRGKCLLGDTCNVTGSVCNLATQLCQCEHSYIVESTDLSCRVGEVASTLDNTGRLMTFLLASSLCVAIVFVASIIIRIKQRRTANREAALAEYAEEKKSIKLRRQPEDICAVTDEPPNVSVSMGVMTKKYPGGNTVVRRTTLSTIQEESFVPSQSSGIIQALTLAPLLEDSDSESQPRAQWPEKAERVLFPDDSQIDPAGILAQYAQTHTPLLSPNSDDPLAFSPMFNSPSQPLAQWSEKAERVLFPEDSQTDPLHILAQYAQTPTTRMYNSDSNLNLSILPVAEVSEIFSAP